MNSTSFHLAASGALASLLAALTLSPLLTGTAWLVAVTVLVAVVALAGVLLRPLVPWWPLIVAVQLAVVTITFTALFARDVAVLGVLPGPASWEVFADLLRTGLASTRDETPPVSTGHSLIFVVALGIALVAVLVDIIAVALRKPAVAGLPLLAVYCVPAAVLPAGLSWWWFVIGAAGFVVLIGADAADRVHAWGRVLDPAGDETRDNALGGPLAGGRRLAAGCLVGAVVVPALIPGLGEQLFGDRNDRPGEGRGNITVINPILRIRENLTQRDDVLVLRYRTTTSSPEPLRIVSNDSFDGNQWAPSVGPIRRSNKVQNGLPEAPGLTPAVGTTRLRTDIETLDLRQTYLPLPYPTTKVEIDGPWLFDPQTLNVVGDQVNTQNLRYAAQHLGVAPTAEQLQAAPAAPPEVLDRYAKLPAGLPREIAATARRVAGTGNAYEQALALQQWFRDDGGFRYSDKVLPPPGKDASSQDAVTAFLRTKQGYCVQFASAMAVMARTLGIPSRVGVGFLPGDQRPDGIWEISIRDAHAWPELFFPSVGWVRFEPTPGARAGEVPEWAAPAGPEPAAEPTPSATASQAAPEAAPGDVQAEEQAPAEDGPPVVQRLIEAVPWRFVLVVLLVAALAGVPLACARAVRWLRWRRAGSAPGPVRVEAAWDELRERLEDLGVTWAASWTPRALRLRLVTDHQLGGTERAALGRLVTDLELARYAPPGSTAREIADLRSDVAAVAAGVAASAAVPAWTRHRARWLPASGYRGIVRAARRRDVIADLRSRRPDAAGRPAGRR